MSDRIGVSAPARLLNRLTAPNSAPPAVLRFHSWLYDRSGGLFGHGMIGAPTLLLRTRGRRSGATRTAALVYARDGEDFVVAASNDGADRNPAWFWNVQAHPAVELQVGRTKLRGTARVLEHGGPEYAQLWEAINATNNRRYDHYQRRTSRKIPLVVVTPAARAG